MADTATVPFSAPALAGADPASTLRQLSLAGYHVVALHRVVLPEVGRPYCSCGTANCATPGRHPIHLPGVQEHAANSAAKTPDEVERLLGAVASRAGVSLEDVASAPFNVGIVPHGFVGIRFISGQGLDYLGSLGQEVKDAIRRAPTIEDPAGFYTSLFTPATGGLLRNADDGVIGVAASAGILVAPPSVVLEGSRSAHMRWIAQPRTGIPEMPTQLESALTERFHFSAPGNRLVRVTDVRPAIAFARTDPVLSRRLSGWASKSASAEAKAIEEIAALPASSASSQLNRRAHALGQLEAMGAIATGQAAEIAYASLEKSGGRFPGAETVIATAIEHGFTSERTIGGNRDLVGEIIAAAGAQGIFVPTTPAPTSASTRRKTVPQARAADLNPEALAAALDALGEAVGVGLAAAATNPSMRSVSNRFLNLRSEVAASIRRLDADQPQYTRSLHELLELRVDRRLGGDTAEPIVDAAMDTVRVHLGGDLSSARVSRFVSSGAVKGAFSMWQQVRPENIAPVVTALAAFAKGVCPETASIKEHFEATRSLVRRLDSDMNTRLRHLVDLQGSTKHFAGAIEAAVPKVAADPNEATALRRLEDAISASYAGSVLPEGLTPPDQQRPDIPSAPSRPVAAGEPPEAVASEVAVEALPVPDPSPEPEVPGESVDKEELASTLDRLASALSLGEGIEKGRGKGSGVAAWHAAAFDALPATSQMVLVERMAEILRTKGVDDTDLARSYARESVGDASRVAVVEAEPLAESIGIAVPATPVALRVSIPGDGVREPPLDYGEPEALRDLVIAREGGPRAIRSGGRVLAYAKAETDRLLAAKTRQLPRDLHDDYTQDVSMDLARGLARYAPREGSSMAAFANSIAVNTFRHKLEELKQSSKVASLDAPVRSGLGNDGSSLAELIPAKDPGPEEVVQAGEAVNDRVDAIVRQMPPESRKIWDTALDLITNQGYSPVEVFSTLRNAATSPTKRAEIDELITGLAKVMVTNAMAAAGATDVETEENRSAVIACLADDFNMSHAGAEKIIAKANLVSTPSMSGSGFRL